MLLTKTIIHVWHYPKGESFWGLGDMIRGTIFLHQYCKQQGYQYYVDLRHHSISQYLLEVDHPHKEYVDANENVWECMCDKFTSTEEFHEAIRLKFMKTNILCIFCNQHELGTIEEDTKTFMKKLLQPTPEFEADIETTRGKLHSDTYNILHVRMGDDFLVNQNDFYMDVLDKLSLVLELFIASNDVLMSDSMVVKQYLHYKYQILTLDTRPSHIGVDTHNANIKDSLLEFFLLMRANTIKTYSIYSWISGFVHSVHKIYNVPIINMKPQDQPPIIREKVDIKLRFHPSNDIIPFEYNHILMNTIATRTKPRMSMAIYGI
jgi:hypothetical protein